MKYALVIVAALLLSACQSPYTYGYKEYDPCITCGEGWSFIPNERFAAQKSADRQPIVVDKAINRHYIKCIGKQKEATND